GKILKLHPIVKHRLPAILPSPRGRTAAPWITLVTAWACVGMAAPPAASVYGRRPPDAPLAGAVAQPNPPAAEVDAQAERIVATALAHVDPGSAAHVSVARLRLAG
ncbi:MAG: hypothetical protein ACKOBP_09530, partial [Planctomycetia bacterium]